MSAGARQILIVEDEFLIAMDLTDELSSRGYEIAGPAGSVSEAMRLIEQETPRLAILDINLKGDPSFPVAEALAERAVPFLFLSGNDATSLPETFRDRPILAKPIDFDALTAKISELDPA